ncbi:MAG: hypothetical protein IPJ30_20940 [Acidobacteria bacterium]|nr:hypothetical protein [Acidobacteriota bacterium]
MRALLPAETLVYLETNDLGRLLGSLQDTKAFEQAMKSKTDFSALNGLQLAVAVTGFEASENQVTTENSVLNFKPRFVAVGDTHSWNRYTLQFVEEKLGNFINETYGGEVQLERTDRATGKHFVWTATDGRKVFAFVSGSRVFFSNDETALEKCLAVARGEGESLMKNEALARLSAGDANVLANGYVSADGIAQLSNVAGVSTALEATDDEDGRSFIARVFPEFVRRSVKEVVWTATKTETGVEDRFTLTLNQETAGVFKETMKPATSEVALADLVPSEPFGATRYNLDNPQVAWRSLLLVAGRNTDATSGNIIVAFAGSLLEPYGVSDAETFLSAVGSEIWTASIDTDGDKSVAIVSVKDIEKVKRSIAGIDFKLAPEMRENAEIRRSADGETAAILIDGKLVIGDPEAALKCLDARLTGQNFSKNTVFARFKGNNAPAVTFGKEATDRSAALLGKKKEENLQFLTNYLTETRFNDRGLERRTTSPFGLVGRILEQLDD